MKFKNFKMIYKLMSLVALLTLATAAVSVVGTIAVTQLARETTMVETAGTETAIAARLRQNVIALNRAQYRLALDPSEEGIARVGKAIAAEREQFAEELAAARSTADARQASLLDEIEAAYQGLIGSIDQTLAVARQNGAQVTANAAQQEIANTARAGRNAANTLESAVGAYADFTDELGAEITADARAIADRMTLLMITIAAGGVFGGLAIGYLVAKLGIGRPIRASVDSLRSLAGGNLGTEIAGTDRRDELGDIARGLQVFKESMIKAEELQAKEAAESEAREARAKRIEELTAGFDAAVGDTLRTLASAATELEATAHTLVATAEQTDRQSTTVAAASEQATSNVQTVASASEELNASISEIGRQVGQSTEISTKAVEQAESTNTTVRGLANAAQTIGDVVNLIQDIASQTNLLALNATIEAARAGEAGKGFAVVANEVKRLASQTAKATEEISAQIASVQNETQSAVGAIEQIGIVIGEISHIATTIASAVEEQSAATSEISRNVQEAAAGTQQVSNNINGVSEGAGQTRSAAKQVLEASGQLSENSSALKSMVDKFLAEVRAA